MSDYRCIKSYNDPSDGYVTEGTEISFGTYCGKREDIRKNYAPILPTRNSDDSFITSSNDVWATSIETNPINDPNTPDYNNGDQNSNSGGSFDFGGGDTGGGGSSSDW